MKIAIFCLFAAAILLFGCAQQGGAETGSGKPAAGGSGGQIVGVGGTAGTGSGQQETARGGSGGAIVGIEQPEPGPGDVVVRIKDFRFEPRDVAVKQGKTVFWYNEDTTPHTVRMIGVFDSPYIAKDGGPYWHTFTEGPGVYEYSCGIHGTMAGSITVVR